MQTFHLVLDFVGSSNQWLSLRHRDLRPRRNVPAFPHALPCRMGKSAKEGKRNEGEEAQNTHYEDDEPPQDAHAAMQKSPRTMYNEYIASAKTTGQRRELPTVRMDDHHYSSTAMMLKKTKQEVETYNADLSVLNTICELPVSEDVRKTVAKIFADPRHAAAISDAEWRRREQSYARNRERFGDRVAEMIGREQQHAASEMKKLSE